MRYNEFMKTRFLHIFFVASLWATVSLLSVGGMSPAAAQPVINEGVIDLEVATEDATDAATATDEAEQATASATLEQIVQQKQDADITETAGEQRSKLARYLDENPPGPLSWHNFLQHAIYGAVANGLPANIVVLIILFPVITSIIAASRHLIGLKGFGIYVPAVLSVAFVSTGIGTGMIIFLTVLTAALLFRNLVKRLKLQYLPRAAMLLWGVSVAVLLLIVFAANTGISVLLTLNIFPLLIIMLISENFIETQLMSSQSQAVRLTLETIIIAIICSLVISSEDLQRIVIINPELTILAVAGINILVGKYSGLRLLEYLRFGPLLER